MLVQIHKSNHNIYKHINRIILLKVDWFHIAYASIIYIFTTHLPETRMGFERWIASYACAFPASSVGCYKGSTSSGAWFSRKHLDRTEAIRKPICKAEEMEDKKKRKKNEDSSNSDRVTLKKEIGLLSACAIIIGEFVTAFVMRAQLMESGSK